MARYRIMQRPSYYIPSRTVFEVEERFLFWWEYRDLFFTLEEAEQCIAQLRLAKPVERKIVKEYD